MKAPTSVASTCEDPDRSTEVMALVQQAPGQGRRQEPMEDLVPSSSGGNGASSAAMPGESAGGTMVSAAPRGDIQASTSPGTWESNGTAGGIGSSTAWLCHGGKNGVLHGAGAKEGVSHSTSGTIGENSMERCRESPSLTENQSRFVDTVARDSAEQFGATRQPSSACRG